MTLRQRFGKSRRGFCEPQILATCKQIYDEAYDVLYGDNRMELEIVLNQLPVGLGVCNGNGVDIEINGEEVQIVDKSLLWPSYMKKLTCLKLSLHLEPDFPWLSQNEHLSRLERLKNTLNDLHTFLFADDIKLRELHVEITSNLVANDNRVVEIQALASKFPGHLERTVGTWRTAEKSWYTTMKREE